MLLPRARLIDVISRNVERRGNDKLVHVRVADEVVDQRPMMAKTRLRAGLSGARAAGWHLAVPTGIVHLDESFAVTNKEIHGRRECAMESDGAHRHALGSYKIRARSG